jgi:hypothetical protein
MDRSKWIAAFGATLIAAPLHAEPPAPEPDTGTIEVVGKRVIDKAIISDSIAALSRRIKALEMVPRFHDPVCLQVTGPDLAANRIIAERIMQAAELTGLDKPRPNCRTNALVILVDDPEDLLDQVIRHRRQVIGGLERDVPIRRLREEIAAGRPAIAWNRQVPIKPNTINVLGDGPPASRSPFTSRMESRMIVSKYLSVVVFDTDRLAGAAPAQLGDYAAMHLLGNPARNIDFESVTTRSILGLFANGPDVAPKGLTAFDRAYIEGSYSAGRNAWTGNVTRAALAAYEAECTDEKPACQFLPAAKHK